MCSKPYHYSAMGFMHFLFFLCYVLISISFTIGQQCYDTGNFTTNSTYANNRNHILSSLVEGVQSNNGFFTGSTGQGSDKVYALALCRGDLSPKECTSCINSTSQVIMTECPNQKEAYKWVAQALCLVRYADRYFYGKLELKPEQGFYNIANLTSDMTQFGKIWGNLTDSLSKKASTSLFRYATEEAHLATFDTIYAQMQCTQDLSQKDCDMCLRQYVANYKSCCYGKQGGGFLGPNCLFRWDLYPFYKDIISLPPPASMPTPPSTIMPGRGSGGGGGGIATAIVVIIVFSTIIIIMVFVALLCVLVRRRNRKQKISSKQRRENADETETVESLQFNFSTIKVATNDFSNDNKLGQGGFGAVYKGILSDGRIIAVKRLASNSEQGELEFKNEILLVARLQHRNLVRFLGFCLEGSERLLIYEFVPNSSLDNFIFDSIKRSSLDWEKRYKIIGGIARGILYLHEDSRLRIIHRDLKASNILIDQDMNPKISDFGMARLFERDQTQADTRRVVGTFGYMAPEYVLHGNFSVKSDVFSFGVLVLEIISGQKNSSFHNGEETGDLLTFAWENWMVGTALNVIDPILRVGSSSEMMRCVHIELLCVQENLADRPTMASVVLMLNSYSISLPLPTKPAFFMHTTIESTMSDQSKSHSVKYSINEVSITELDPR